MNPENLLSCKVTKKQLELRVFIDTNSIHIVQVFKNKVRLVVKVYSHIPGVDYGDTFAQ